MLKYLFSFLCFVTFACTPQQIREKDLEKKLEKMLYREVIFDSDDNRLKAKNPKIIILLQDTADCSKCQMEIYRWYLYRLDMESRALKADILYAVSDSSYISKEIDSVLATYKLGYVDVDETFLKKNEIPREKVLHTFLIDRDNRIQVVGPPIGNQDLWNVYKEKIEAINNE